MKKDTSLKNGENQYGRKWMDKVKIMVCMPNTGSVNIHTVQGLISLIKEEYAKFAYCFITGSDISDQRNKCVEYALHEKADYVLWVDSDMKFNPEDFRQLIADDKDIVTGLYFTKSDHPVPTIFSRIEGQQAFVPIKNYPEGLFKIGYCGSGFILVKSDVYRKIGKDYYTHIDNVSEDFSFCERALQNGFDVWCDSTIKVGHVGMYIYSEKDFKR